MTCLNGGVGHVQTRQHPRPQVGGAAQRECGLGRDGHHREPQKLGAFAHPGADQLETTPPRPLARSADVRKIVAGNPHGIRYIEKSAADASVKVVLTVN